MRLLATLLWTLAFFAVDTKGIYIYVYSGSCSRLLVCAGLFN